MQLFKIGALATATSLVAGCGGGGGGGEVPPLLGPGATQAEADAAILALETEVDDVFLADGPTEYAALPAGSATYTGLVYGSADGGSGPATSHAADLDLTVDFDTDGVTGTIYNFVTDVTDFEYPTGTIDVTGSVFNDSPNAGISLDGNGLLTGTNGVTANYSIFGVAEGLFGGTDASVIDGVYDSNFNWLTGPNNAETSFSDGRFAATRD